MALNVPTTEEIKDLIISQMELALNQAIPLLPKAFQRVLAKALSGVIIILYKYASFIFLQIFVTSATFTATTINGRILQPLLEWGRLIGVGDPTSATNAELIVDVTVENQTGFLQAGTQLTSNANQVLYSVTTDVALDAATIQANVLAVNDADNTGGGGVIGNLDLGSVISFVSPVDNVARDTVVDSTVTTGADGESVDAYRQRVIDRFQKKPQGGALADYEAWAEEVPGIINAYPYTGDAGEVDVYSEATPESSGSADGIPTAPQLQAVKDSIELDENGKATRRPVLAFVNSLPITRTSFDVDITGLVVDNEAQVKQDIDAGLTSYFLEREPFIVGLSVSPRTDKITVNNISAIVDDFVSAANGTFTSVAVEVTSSGSPFTEYQLGEGEKAKLNVVVYTP